MLLLYMRHSFIDFPPAGAAVSCIFCIGFTLLPELNVSPAVPADERYFAVIVDL